VILRALPLLLVAGPALAETPAPDWPPPGADPAAITVGSVTNGTSGGVTVGPVDQVRQRLLSVLQERDLPVVVPVAPDGPDGEPGAARFVLNGVVTDQACHRETHWSGCRWRVTWSLFDRTQDRVVLEAGTVGEASIPQANPTSDMYVEILARALLPVTRAPEVRTLVFEADTRSTPGPVGWSRQVPFRRCTRDDLSMPADTRALQPTLLSLPTADTRVDAVVFSPDGLALSRARPLADTDLLTGTWADGSEVRVTVVRVDVEADVALLAVDGTDLPCAPVAQVPTLGAPVYALGTRGASGWGLRQGVVEGRLAGPVGARIESTAPVEELSPGAALFDSQGRVVGSSTGSGPALSALSALDRLGLEPSDTPAQLAGLDRRPTRGAPIQLDTAGSGPLQPPVGPGRTYTTFADVPGGTDVALGGTLIAVGAIVAVPSALVWAAEENGFGITPGQRATYATLTGAGVLLAGGGALLLNRGLTKANASDVEVVIGPGNLGVRGRF